MTKKLLGLHDGYLAPKLTNMHFLPRKEVLYEKGFQFDIGNL